MDQNTRQLAFDFGTGGEAVPAQGEGCQATGMVPCTGTLAQSLIEAMSTPKLLRRALKRVKANGGSPGVDGMTVRELGPYLTAHWPALYAQLLEGTYRPQPVRRVMIPKPGGGMRELGIPPVVDRFIQQLLLQVLEPLFDPTFSPHSYGFRPGKNAHQAVTAAQEIVAAGKGWVVDLDLAQFFDTVNHDILLGLLMRRIRDRRVLALIRAFLRAGVLADGVVLTRHEGTPQGGPLSPLLANILLDQLDQELTQRGHTFCRYADDCNIYVQSRRAGERVMASVTRFLEHKLHLRVNTEKSAVARPAERQFLGFRLMRDRGTIRIRIAPKALTRAKQAVREITQRNRGVSLAQVLRELKSKLMGWVTYYALAQAKSVMEELDGWIRRRLRCYVWKQWKTARTRVAHLRRAGIGPWLAWGLCNRHGHGPWSVSRHAALQKAIPNSWLQAQGYQSLAERYQTLAAA